VLALCATALAWYFTHSASVRDARSRFEAEIRVVQIDLSDRLGAYEQVLRGGVSAFYSWPSVRRENWGRFVANLQIGENYPGIQGIGFAEIVPPVDLASHVRQVRSEGFSDYRVWPEGERPIYTSIIYLEPFDWRNQRAFGYDMFSEPVRRSAMERARDTGMPSLSGKVKLVQETSEAVQVGFLMYLPVYRSLSPASVEERRRELRGYVYSPFRMGDFMHGLLGEREHHVALEIFDGEAVSEDDLMYSTVPSESRPALEAATFVTVAPFTSGGHSWTLRFSSLPTLEVDRGKPLLVLGGGTIVSFLLSAIAWSLANNRAQAAEANVRLQADIKRREEIEAQLRDKETSFRYLFEKNPNPMWVFDRGTLAIFEVNDAAVARYGYTHEEFRRLTIADLRPPEDVSRLLTYVKERATGLKAAGEWQHITKNGRKIDVEITSYTLEFQHRDAVLVVARDITESKRTGAALRESEAVARGVLDAALDAYIRMDDEGRITEWNAMAERAFGWSRAEAVGRSVADTIIPAGQRAAHRRGLARFLETGKAVILNRRIELWALHRSGNEFPIELTVLALDTVNGRVFSAFARDLTDRKQAEAQLRQAQKMEAVGQLTGGVAHDFNNLLTVIVGNLDFAAGPASKDPELAAAVDRALSAAETGAALTHRLLAFSRQQALQPENTDLNQVVRGMTDLLRRTLGEDVEIGIRLDDELWPALADRSQVESALLNLAINARDSMPDGGKLTIETANTQLDADYAARNAEVAPGDYAVLVVSDTGGGMTPEVAERALEPFFTTKGIGKGSGLGLSMIYGFAKQSGGHLKIYSEPGHGTTVRLYLPRTATREATAEIAAAPSKSERGTEAVLVVEDDPDVRQLAAAQLRSLGYQVLEAPDGASAVTLLEGGARIDLLFTDVVMPGGMNGQQLAEKARELRPQLKVLFTSGYTPDSIAHQGKIDPGVFLLSKPYRRDGLARKVREILDSGKAGLHA
jgi:PAS domain S-box-containing protein